MNHSTFSIRNNLIYVRVGFEGRPAFDLEIGKVTDASGKVAVLPGTSWGINRMEQAGDQELVSDELLEECREWLYEQGYDVELPASDLELVTELRGGPVEPQGPAPLPATVFEAADMEGLDIDDVMAGDDDGYPFPGFADPGGESALRAATPRNPRNQPCPTCGAPNRLTPADVANRYQCDACANQAERGF